MIECFDGDCHDGKAVSSCCITSKVAASEVMFPRSSEGQLDACYATVIKILKRSNNSICCLSLKDIASLQSCMFLLHQNHKSFLLSYVFCCLTHLSHGVQPLSLKDVQPDKAEGVKQSCAAIPT